VLSEAVRRVSEEGSKHEWLQQLTAMRAELQEEFLPLKGRVLALEDAQAQRAAQQAMEVEEALSVSGEGSSPKADSVPGDTQEDAAGDGSKAREAWEEQDSVGSNTTVEEQDEVSSLDRELPSAADPTQEEQEMEVQDVLADICDVVVERVRDESAVQEFDALGQRCKTLESDLQEERGIRKELEARLLKLEEWASTQKTTAAGAS